ncbi:MAG: hypothetical protein CSB48_01855 [Proteobacteria bacterium]|nr:MAG: hypothetical protein CSB48_01855 [Pseudomonadota bacterium]PIE40393.1 MAG: hypothetical protein CSA51_00935 [Gammaproteobacteria bacterium]
MKNVSNINERAPLRLVKVSLAFSLVNFFVQGLNWDSLLVFILFTSSVYVSAQIALLVNSPDFKMIPEIEPLRLNLLAFCGIFIVIATFAYSCLFGVFYAVIGLIYLISPYDREWLTGQSKIVIVGNKVEYRKGSA